MYYKLVINGTTYKMRTRKMAIDKLIELTGSIIQPFGTDERLHDYTKSYYETHKFDKFGVTSSKRGRPKKIIEDDIED